MKLFLKPMMLSLTVAVAATLSSAVLAKDFPSGTITLTVPYAPGGGTDIPARQVAEKIMANTGWSIIVQNQPGAGGNIGLAQVARRAPDGLNIGMGQTSNLAVNPTLYKDIPYNASKDFTHIGLVTTQPMAIVTYPKSPFKTLQDFIDAARKAPGNVLFGTPGSGTVSHLALEQLASRADLELTHVPYPGIAGAITDVMAGVVDVYVGSIPSVLPHIRSGGVRVLAVTSPERSPVLPETPTVASFGFDDFNASDWKALVGPAGMPADVVQALNGALNDALKDEKLRGLFEAEGSTVLGGTSEEFAQYHAKELEAWAEVVKASGATVN